MKNLTPTENEIIRLSISGLTNTEIAEKMQSSYRTIETHFKNIKNKLKYKTLPQMAGIYLSETSKSLKIVLDSVVEAAYYNTTNETGKILKRNTEKAERQYKQCKAMFMQYPNSELCAERIKKSLNLRADVRDLRARISTLLAQGIVEKTENKIIGYKNRSVYLYKLKSVE